MIGSIYITGTIVAVVIVCTLIQMKRNFIFSSDPQTEIIRETTGMINQLYQLDVDNRYDVMAIQDEFRRDAIVGDMETLRQHHRNIDFLLTTLE